MIYFALVLFCVVFGLFFIRLVYLSSISAVKIVATECSFSFPLDYQN